MLFYDGPYYVAFVDTKDMHTNKPVNIWAQFVIETVSKEWQPWSILLLSEKLSQNYVTSEGAVSHNLLY